MAASLRLLDPQLRPYVDALLTVGRQLGLQPRVTSTRRSRAEQTALYRAWLAGRNPYPVARPGTSDHELGWAVDIVCTDPPQLGEIWKSWGGRWSPRDEVHFAGP